MGGLEDLTRKGSRGSRTRQLVGQIRGGANQNALKKALRGRRNGKENATTYDPKSDINLELYLTEHAEYGTNEVLGYYGFSNEEANVLFAAYAKDIIINGLMLYLNSDNFHRNKIARGPSDVDNIKQGLVATIELVYRNDYDLVERLMIDGKNVLEEVRVKVSSHPLDTTPYQKGKDPITQRELQSRNYFVQKYILGKDTELPDVSNFSVGNKMKNNPFDQLAEMMRPR